MTFDVRYNTNHQQEEKTDRLEARKEGSYESYE